jgi:hypothetical protein
MYPWVDFSLYKPQYWNKLMKARVGCETALSPPEPESSEANWKNRPVVERGWKLRLARHPQ